MLKFVKIRDVKSPIRAHRTDAGIDFYVPNDAEPITLKHGEDAKIPAGVKVVIPEGYALIFNNKSGKAVNNKFDVGACVVDSDYRGEVHLHVFNFGLEDRVINPGDKLVQGILQEVSLDMPEEISEEEYESYCNTERGEGGFGSTGTK